MEVFAKFKNEINRVIIEIPMGYEKGMISWDSIGELKRMIDWQI